MSDDTCLYIENFAFRVANSSHLDATTKTQVTQGFEYYLGLDGNTTAEEIAGEVRISSVKRCVDGTFCLREACCPLTSLGAGGTVLQWRLACPPICFHRCIRLFQAQERGQSGSTTLRV